jgi:hypothetical protein
MAITACLTGLEYQFQSCGIEALAADQLAGEIVQQTSTLTLNRRRARERLSQQPVDFLVDHFANAFRVIALPTDIVAEDVFTADAGKSTNPHSPWTNYAPVHAISLG